MSVSRHFWIAFSITGRSRAIWLFNPAMCRSARACAILRTIRDACDYMTGMDKKRELRTHWQRVAKLILAKEDVLTVSRALEAGPFMTPSKRGKCCTESAK